VEGRFKEFYHRLSDGDYCVIPFWGGGSKNFITAFQTVIFIFSKKTLFQASGITA